MKEAYIKLHLSIILAGFTGILGKLITLNEGLLVWYRMLITSILFFIFLWFANKFKKVSWKEFFKISAVGLLLALHWVFFYGSIKASNVSIGVVCFSLTGFFTAIFEPIINRHKISLKELLFSLIAVLGIILIFQLDVRFRTGIILGIISSALASLFVIMNKRVGINHSSSTMLLYEMIGGFILISIFIPFYLYYFPVDSFTPSAKDFMYLILLSVFCTIGLYMLQIQALKKISAFTVNLSYNLEPIYSIVLAILIFNEAKELNMPFYLGLGLIILSVLLQMYAVKGENKKAPLSE
ncbi:MAG: DMT family transporter [Dysgonomonas sp.]|nr:DMT family transporter [Dysgonomonas sp.]